jgi:sec-independent protein translocase protein TatB
MFDIGWSEILVIAVVTIVVVGPKDLPRMLRTFGKTMGQVRRTANDFKRQFDDALREAEREVDLEDTKKQLSSIAKANPLADIRKDIESTFKDAGKGADGTPAAAAPTAIAAPPAEAETPEAAVHEAEPLKTGAAGTGSAAP